MAKIKILDQETINQIAAGEVVERPSSIVKELVENAIDASSTSVTVEIKGGGIDFIRITDNGSGIEKDQVANAFLPHATSKITSASDLLTVASLGFRGEALSSIAAVARVELITKTDEGIAGIRYVIEGGEEKSKEEIGCPEGTTFVIRDLFYNTPARRKFLKSKMTESGYVEAFIQRLALSHPDISFKFICDNKNKMATSGNGNLKDVIYHIFGRDVAANLLAVENEENGIRVEGFVGKPVISRGNRNYENYFVNGRYLKNNVISRAIEEGYKGHSMVHKFPFTALMITMDPYSFDANVHPAKMEMRFKNAEEMYTAIVNAVRKSFIKKELIPQVAPGKTQKAKPQIQAAPEPFEKKRREIEQRFASLSEEKIREIEAKKSESESEAENPDKSILPGKSAANQNAAPDQSTASSQSTVPGQSGSAGSRIAARIAGLHLGSSRSEDEAMKKEIDAAIPSRPECPPEKWERQGDAKQASGPAGQEQPEMKLQSGPGAADITANITADITTATADTVKEADIYGKQISFADIPLLSKEARPKHRIIGQVFQTYWMVEFEDKLFFVDQHAAHEKVMYEKLKKDLENNTIHQQLVAPPIVLTFSIREKEIYENCSEAFAKLGFQIEEFGGSEYCIRAVPANLLDIDPQELFIELFDQLEENGGKMNTEIITDRLATMACKAAVKGNTTMSVQEMDSLMDQLLELDNPYQCPHGRPTIISMTKYEIEKKFKRVQ